MFLQKVSLSKCPVGCDWTSRFNLNDVRAGDTVILGIRPEHLSLEAGPGSDTLNLDVYVTESLGGETILYGHVDDTHTLVVKVAGGTHAQRGQRIAVRIRPEMCHLFSRGWHCVRASARGA